MRLLKMMALVAVALTGAACADLDVENLNNPDRERAISTPDDVESLIVGSFTPWFRSRYSYWAGAGAAMSNMADDHSATWGNFGMNDAQREPREPLNNDPSYGYSYIIEGPWTQSYRALAGIRDGLRAIEGGVEIGEGGEDTHRAVTFARLMQGLSLATLALQYDQAFILDETTDVENTSMVGYQEVANAAIAKLEEAINLANQQSFTVPGGWMGQISHDNVFIAQLAHTYIARVMANTPRTVAEREAVNWQAVLDHLNQGITEDWLVDGQSLDVDNLKSWGGVYSGWARWDMRSIGPADQSGNWETWIATPLEQRDAFLLDTPDRRLTPEGHFASPEAGDAGLYVEYQGANTSPWPANRGTYAYSDYRDSRHDDYAFGLSTGSPRTGIIALFNMAEVDFLMAEAMFRMGNQAGALDIVNSYRTTNGQMAPATLAGDDLSDGVCVPQDGQGNCPDLWEVLKYEKRMETYHYNWATAYFDDRGWGDLVPNTAVHFPVPGEELLLLLQDIYTHGGGEGDSAPDQVTDFGSSLATITPDVLNARRRALEAFDQEYGMRNISYSPN